MSEEENKDEVAAAPAEEAAPVEETKEEVPAETPAEEAEEVEVPDKFKKLVEEVESMSVLELNELVKVLEKKFGVSAVAAAAAPAAGGDAAGEQDEFSISLVDPGAQKIAVIKVIKEVLGLGLKEAKELTDNVPADIKTGIKKEEADEIKAKLEEAGAKVELK